MKIGKLPEPALIRSVLKQVGHRREEVLVGPSVGQDCGAFAVSEGEAIVMSSDPITGTTKDLGSHCIHITVNDLAAAGAEPIGVMLTMLLPPTIKESQIKKIMQDAESVCRSLNIEIIGGHTEITTVVTQPVITVTGVGKISKEKLMTVRQIRADQDIVITKWIGLEATAILAKEKEAELSQRFPAALIEKAKGFDQYLSVVPESRIAMAHNGVTSMHDITEGGIFGALWELVNGAGLGLDVDMRKIPICQETVEICEHFGLNPYMIMSSGSMMIVTDDGHELVRKLELEGIHAVVVGRTTDSKDKVIRKGEDIRYLDKPQPDELYKAL